MDLAVDVGSSEIAVEGFAARETYQRVVKDALRRTQTPHPIRVTTWPPKGSGRGGGDAMARSAALLQALEVGTARIAGHLPDLEQAAVTWQAGQHQPDALAAKLADALVGLALDPEDAALPLEVLAATVVASRPPTEEWRFSEGARRGDSGWTARFSVDIEVDMAMVSAPSVSTEHTKVLRAVGRRLHVAHRVAPNRPLTA